MNLQEILQHAHLFWACITIVPRTATADTFRDLRRVVALLEVLDIVLGVGHDAIFGRRRVDLKGIKTAPAALFKHGETLVDACKRLSRFWGIDFSN